MYSKGCWIVTWGANVGTQSTGQLKRLLLTKAYSGKNINENPLFPNKDIILLVGELNGSKQTINLSLGR